MGATEEDGATVSFPKVDSALGSMVGKSVCERQHVHFFEPLIAVQKRYDFK